MNADPSAEQALAKHYELMDRLVESERVQAETTERLTADVESCGPFASVAYNRSGCARFTPWAYADRVRGRACGELIVFSPRARARPRRRREPRRVSPPGGSSADTVRQPVAALVPRGRPDDPQRVGQPGQRAAGRARLSDSRGLEPRHARPLQPARGLGAQPSARHHRPAAAARRAHRARRRGSDPPRRGRRRTGAASGHPHRGRLRRSRRRALSGLRRALERRRPARRRRRELRLRRSLPERRAAGHPRLRAALGPARPRRRHLLPHALAALDRGLRRAGREHRDQPLPPRRPLDLGARGAVAAAGAARVRRAPARRRAAAADPPHRPPAACRRALVPRALVPAHGRRGRADRDGPPPASRRRARVRRQHLPPLPPLRRPRGHPRPPARAARPRSSGRAWRSPPTSTRWSAPPTRRPSGPRSAPAR